MVMAGGQLSETLRVNCYHPGQQSRVLSLIGLQISETPDEPLPVLCTQCSRPMGLASGKLNKNLAASWLRRLDLICGVRSGRTTKGEAANAQ
jgi:hypothetical protein